MAAYLQAFREVVGPKPVFRILMPAAGLFFSPDPINLPDGVLPAKVVFEGQLHNGTGRPYNHVNMPGAPDQMFINVVNVANLKTPAKDSPAAGRRIWSTMAAWGAGVPSAIVATPGGLMVGLGSAGLMVAALPFEVPLVVVGGVIAGGGVAAGAAAGAITGLFVGKKVENAWDKAHE